MCEILSLLPFSFFFCKHILNIDKYVHTHNILSTPLTSTQFIFKATQRKKSKLIFIQLRVVQSTEFIHFHHSVHSKATKMVHATTITRITALSSLLTQISAFSPILTPSQITPSSKSSLSLRAPPGSGYASDEDEINYFPETYEPMMEYPGTMRPGTTSENQPFSSLPIQESDPDPVPWPHFQEIEWHHNWGSPHEHPIPMEEFIEMHGRWATAEMEAEMRAGARRGVRERRELEEAQKAASFIIEDDEDDEEEEEVKIDLGQGVNAFIGTDTAPADDKVVEEAVDDDDDGDDFLLDLGLDGSDDTADDDDDDDDDEPALSSGDDSTSGILEAMQNIINEESGDDDDSETELDIDFDDLDLDFDDDDDDAEDDGDDDDDDFVMMDDGDEMDDNEMVPLDDMIDNEDMGEEDEFDDGGFDYD